MDLNKVNLNLEYFELESKRYTKLAGESIDKCSLNYLESKRKVIRKEYSSGGGILERGYYCPSLIYDIVVGNCNRGRLIKKLTAKSKPTYEYGFDADDRLITITQFADAPYFSDTYEVIKYNGRTSMGFVFENKPSLEIRAINECIYDDNNRIISFTRALGNGDGKVIDEIYKELYTYDERGLYVVQVYSFLSISTSRLSHEKYIFSHNDEGYLNEYITNGLVYKVYIKRKV